SSFVVFSTIGFSIALLGPAPLAAQKPDPLFECDSFMSLEAQATGLQKSYSDKVAETQNELKALHLALRSDAAALRTDPDKGVELIQTMIRRLQQIKSANAELK